MNLVGGPIRISSKVDAKIQEMLSLRRDVPNNLRVDVESVDLLVVNIDGSIDDDVDHVEKICDPIRQSTIPGSAYNAVFWFTFSCQNIH